jgi:hypothetical protein
MGDPLLVAVVALGLSLGVSAIRLGHWFIHSDPKAVVRTARWAAIGLAVLSFPLLLVLLFNQQWTAAVALAAVMVLVLAWYGPRLLRQPFRLLDPAPDPSPPATRTAEFAFGGGVEADRALIERSAAVLEEYLRQMATSSSRNGAGLQTVGRGHANGSSRANGHDEEVAVGAMSEKEALEILGLDHGAQDEDIQEAHRRLVQMVHPDRGGSHYLTVKINQAKRVLLGGTGARSRPIPAATSQKAARRRPQRRQHP